jgi:phosphoribosylformylglycinamidine synthase
LQATVFFCLIPCNFALKASGYLENFYTILETTLPTQETAKKLGLTEQEYQHIVELLGRQPNFTELCIYSGMWSEHCSYKNSIVWLKKLPKDSPRMMAKAGEENAGLVDIGDGLAVSFKIESHNHPSAIEPYQGAATGVGGINRDIFTMGARPIAQLNSLRFGDPATARTRQLMKGVVKGIGDYGNAFGVPTVGGEVFFDPSFETNILVNAFSAGLVEHGKVAKAISYGAGNPVFIVGSATGKDGILGAAFASKDISKDSASDLPAVQVGDPFQEKLLLEATLEVIATGAVIGIQDMGAAGIICSTSEMSAKGKHGMVIWLDKVPTRQPNMQAWELLLSESQERMLVVVHKGHEQTVLDIFQKWDLNCAQIGEVIEGNSLQFYMHGELAAEVPAESLVLGGGAPVYRREWKEPAYFKNYKAFKTEEVPIPGDLGAVARFLLSHPNICSKKWVYEQYDSMVGTINMNSVGKSSAPAVKIKNTKKALVMSVDCNSRYVHADPEKGCAIAVAEAARNISCTGATPLAVTNCLNFGNPYNPEVYWQFVGSIKGMKSACEKFGTPVTGGNVSFYNQSESGPVFPTPTIGMIGLLDDDSKLTYIGLPKEKAAIYVVGPIRNDIASSEYLYSWHGRKQSPAPYFNLDMEVKVQEAIRALIAQEKVLAVQDVSDGGIFVALTEMALEGGMGFRIQIPKRYRPDAFLFGESQSRIICCVAPNKTLPFQEYLDNLGIPQRLIGLTNDDALEVEGFFEIPLSEAREIYADALEQKMGLLEKK